MTHWPHKRVCLMLLAVLSACSPEHKNTAQPAAADKPVDALLTVGTIRVEQPDLDYQLKENHAGRIDEQSRKIALTDLAERARLAQAALDANLQQDPMVRAEFARILANRYKEINLSPHIKAALEAPIPESRLRELYTASESHYRSNEKRQVAVLWLNPNGDPQREQQYIAKLNTAREWLFNNSDLKNHPEQGFSTLSVDYSEHQASRYQSGVVGWVENNANADAWTKSLAEIVFTLPELGTVSAVITKPEGVFLVRYMAMKPAMQRSFESVANELKQTERQRMRQSAETDFNHALDTRYPINWLKP